MAGRLKGKLVFLTAAGQGIGRAIAEAFIAEGATVIATDLDAAKLKASKKAKTFALDVTKTDAVNALAEKVIKEFGTPNVLGNFAGWVHQGSILECSEADWDRSFDVNVKSMHRVLRAFVPAMLKNGGGSIINIASVASSVRGLPKRYAYGSTKAAVIGLTKAMAADFIKQGLRCQRDLPRHHPVAVARPAHRSQCQGDRQIARCGAPGLRRPPADRPVGNSRGDRGRRGVPRFR